MRRHHVGLLLATCLVLPAGGTSSLAAGLPCPSAADPTGDAESFRLQGGLRPAVPPGAAVDLLGVRLAVSADRVVLRARVAGLREPANPPQAEELRNSVEYEAVFDTDRKRISIYFEAGQPVAPNRYHVDGEVSQGAADVEVVTDPSGILSVAVPMQKFLADTGGAAKLHRAGVLATETISVNTVGNSLYTDEAWLPGHLAVPVVPCDDTGPWEDGELAPWPAVLPLPPRAGCTTAAFEDDAGDAWLPAPTLLNLPVWPAAAPVPYPVESQDGLDLTGVSVGTFRRQLVVAIGVRDVDRPARYAGQDQSAVPVARMFYVSFNIAKDAKDVSALIGVRLTDGPVLRHESSFLRNASGYGGIYPLPASHTVVDTAANTILVAVPLELIRLALDTDQPALDLTGFGAVSTGLLDNWQPPDPVDRATPPATPELAYTTGTPSCYPRLATKLAAPASLRVQYGDPATLTATVRDQLDRPLGGVPVDFALPGRPLRAVTNAAGVASVHTVVTASARSYSVAVSFGGDVDYSGTAGGVTLTVVAETTKLTARSARRGSAATVTATLLDDDGRVVRDQAVTWYVNGRRAGVTRTSHKGVATFTGARAGQRVVAEYAGQAGRYLAAPKAQLTA